MKRITKTSFALILSAMMVSGCNNKPSVHTHSYDKTNPTWAWTGTSDGYNVVMTLTCGGCDESNEGHTVDVDAVVTSTTQDPTCEEGGKITYTATATYDGQTFTDTSEVFTDALGHDFASLTVSGDYKKNYSALEEFDDSNLVVKAVCANCNETKVITADEYFVIYQQFGADRLSVGDTKVTISYSGMKVDVTGLTVSPIEVEKPVADSSEYTYNGNEIVYKLQENDLYTISGNKKTNAGSYVVKVSLNDKVNYAWKDGTTEDLEYTFNIGQADNEITGLQSEYRTGCKTVPDLSGVSSTAGDLTLKYYSDTNCQNEVQLNALTVGTYTVVATSGGLNYKEVSKKASLIVEHVYEQEVVDDECLNTAATIDNDATYYKSCACGEKGTETFVASNTKLPFTIASSSVSAYEVVTDEEAPRGYSTVTRGTKTYVDTDQGRLFLTGLDISSLATVRFAFKTANRKFCDRGWGDALPTDTWYEVVITNNLDGTYTCEVKSLDGEVYFTYENNTSFAECLEYYNYDGDKDPLVWYSTEVIGVKRSDIEVSYLGEKIAESSVTGYEDVVGLAPQGFEKVTKSTRTYNNDDQGSQFLANIDIHKAQNVYFAFKTVNRKICNSSWGTAIPMDSWHMVKIGKNANGTFTSQVMSMDGVVKFEYPSIASFAEALPYYNYDGDAEPMEFYSTEVRAEMGEDEPVPVTGTVVDACMMSANGVEVTPSTEAVPDGYESVYEHNGNAHGQFYSAVDLRNYSEVHFAYKQNGYFLFDGWSELTETTAWMNFSLTQNPDGTWNLVISTLTGAILHTKNNLGAYKGTGTVYTNYSLNAILMGCPAGAGYFASEKSGTPLVVQMTELRGTAKPADLVGTVVDSSAYSANGVGVNRVTQTPPPGYEYVNSVDVGTNGFVHGQFYSATPLNDYSEVHFAMKSSGYILFENWDRLFDGRDQWIFISLTNNDNGTFNLVVKDVNGSEVYSRNNIPATGAGPVYTPYALNTMLYGGAFELKPVQRDGYEFNLFVSELRGTLK